MQPGNPGAPPPGYPAWPQAPAGWPQPPAAATPAWPGPAPSPPGPAPTDAAPAVTEVDLPLQVQLPNQCVCCLGAAETRLRTQGAARANRTTERRFIDLPYCARCAAHVNAVKRRGLVIGIAAVVLGAATPFVLQALWAYAPASVVVLMAPTMALTACGALGLAWKLPAVDRTRGCVGVERAGWIAGFYFHAPTTRVRFRNPVFAAGMARLHHAQARTLQSATTVLASWIVSPITSLLVALLAFFAMHGHVYVDNPTASPISIDVDQGAVSLTLAPGAHDSVYLPLGPVAFVARSGGVDVDRFTGDVSSFGTYVATPTGTGCYGIVTASYGSAMSSGGAGGTEPAQLRWHTLSNVDYVFEPFPHSVSVSQGQSGTTKRRFTRYDCETGQVM